MGELIRKALAALADRRPVFHSEADFQHELAVEISRVDPDVEIRLERPVRLPEARPINLDILLRRYDEQFAVELKYITAELESNVSGEEFGLRAQSARDLRRYDILKDIMRIETLTSAGVVAGGMSVTVTNDPGLWREPRNGGVADAAFRIHQGRTATGVLEWADHTGVGTVRGREPALKLEGKYDFAWQEYSRVEAKRNGEFRMMLVAIGVF